jgi:RNA polymerase sigma-70 factor, ECF subfamily
MPGRKPGIMRFGRAQGPRRAIRLSVAPLPQRLNRKSDRLSHFRGDVPYCSGTGLNPIAPYSDQSTSRSLNVMQTTSDESLIGRIAQGDRLAMQVLYSRHHVRVFRFVLRLVRNEATAEDLISEVFLEVWRQAGKFEGRSAVSTWILAIARFKALSALRRKSEAGLDDEMAEAIPDETDDPEVAVAKKDKGEALRRCLAGLSAEHREIIDLVYYHEKSVEEVSQIVGIPEATVKTRMFYARKKLSELLKAQGIDRGWP